MLRVYGNFTEALSKSLTPLCIDTPPLCIDTPPTDGDTTHASTVPCISSDPGRTPDVTWCTFVQAFVDFTVYITQLLPLQVNTKGY